MRHSVRVVAPSPLFDHSGQHAERPFLTHHSVRKTIL